MDVVGQKVAYKIVDGSKQIDLNHVSTNWTDLDLTRWLDRKVRQIDVRQETMLEFIRRTIADLLEQRKYELSTLARFKYSLVKALMQKVNDYRHQAYERGYQETLFGPAAAVETSFTFAFDFKPDAYEPNWFYKGAYKFQKHYYGVVGELKSNGEEFDCAVAIDRIPQVKHWARNLALKPNTSFWLPTSTDRFYPDFVAELEDSRTLAVEYKGEAYATSDDSKEKRNLGALWESKSNGKGLFIMAEKKDKEGRDIYTQLLNKINSPMA
ncbi:MAG: hypothetical protein HZC51_01640 [Nitrospirae bacterium]|nr:hypothetical protein [Nitrospirota bacterium]